MTSSVDEHMGEIKFGIISWCLLVRYQVWFPESRLRNCVHNIMASFLIIGTKMREKIIGSISPQQSLHDVHVSQYERQWFLSPADSEVPKVKVQGRMDVEEVDADEEVTPSKKITYRCADRGPPRLCAFKTIYRP